MRDCENAKLGEEYVAEEVDRDCERGLSEKGQSSWGRRLEDGMRNKSRV